MDWTYGGLYKKFDMTGDIHVGTGIVRVHDIFDPVPEFMKQADFLFSDPPYNQSALSSFYTKAEKSGKPKFGALVNRFFEVIDIIAPKMVAIEVGVPQTDMFLSEVALRYEYTCTVQSYYYGNKRNMCNIIFGAHEPIPEIITAMPVMDEEHVVEYICKNIEFNCIADPFMGLGLVAFYADKYGKRFVGTELNKYRLSVCLERVSTKKRGTIH